MGEREYYKTIRKWLENQGYYCGGNIKVRGKQNYYQDIGPRYRRADVAGIKNVGGAFEDQVEIVAIEVRDDTTIGDRDISDTVNYKHYAHKCYLATTASITDKNIRIAELRKIGLLKLEGVRTEPTIILDAVPENPQNYQEMIAFLNSFQIVKCSICGCFFERFDIQDEEYKSYLKIIRAKYFNVLKETDDDPLDLRELYRLPSKYKIRRYICFPCFKEFFLTTKRIEKAKRQQQKA